MSREITTFAQRLQFLRETLGLSQRALADKLACSNRTLGDWELGKSQPNQQALEALVRAAGCAPGWLLLGEGRPFEDKPTPSASPLVPVFGRVKAGPGGLTAQSIPEYYVPRPAGIDHPDVFGLEVVGDSAYPVYKPGDVVLCEEEAEPRTGKDYIVLLPDGDPVLKRWQAAGNAENGAALVRLLSWNPDYTPLTYRRDELLGVARVIYQIWGSVAWKTKVLPDDLSAS